MGHGARAGAQDGSAGEGKAHSDVNGEEARAQVTVVEAMEGRRARSTGLATGIISMVRSNCRRYRGRSAVTGRIRRARWGEVAADVYRDCCVGSDVSGRPTVLKWR